ncbi:MAG: hypothetical protein HYX27_27140 [Acidobacteria bacterium]|nr:hypothetical protein [Acidobacteriota bacterium]
MIARLLPFLLIAGLACYSQYAVLRPAPRAELPEVIDGNTAAMWADGQLHIFHSSGVPARSKGADQFTLAGTESVQFGGSEHKPVWFESVWRDDDGTLFLWYHHEPGGVCPGSNLTAPKIGAAVSRDNGRTVEDLGIVLESGERVDCTAGNGFFAGGHGDFSVIADQDRGYFYFFFTNYSGALEEQGVAVARLAFADRFQPSGAVYKYFHGEWNQPGLGGHMSPIFPASIAWREHDANSFWGPSIHWNTALERYVILMNQTCCRPGWPQVGIFGSFSTDLVNWTAPRLILDKPAIPYGPAFYPQVLGLRPGETDSLASATARLYVHGISLWEIDFSHEAPAIVPEPCTEAANPACPDPQ